MYFSSLLCHSHVCSVALLIHRKSDIILILSLYCVHEEAFRLAQEALELMEHLQMTILKQKMGRDPDVFKEFQRDCIAVSY